MLMAQTNKAHTPDSLNITMKLGEIREHILCLYNGGSRDPIHLEGPPGIGKTAITTQISEELEIGHQIWQATTVDPLDIGGLPAVVDGSAVRVPFKQMVPDSGKGLLVIDELTTALPLTQASLYGLVYGRRIGEATLGEDWMIITTGNRDIDRAGVQRMPTPMTNRLEIIKVEEDIDGWTNHMAGVGGAPLVVAFIKQFPHLFSTFNPDIPGPFASARSWDRLSRNILAYQQQGKDLPPMGSVQGIIGVGPTTEFMTFATMASQLVSVDSILMAPDQADVPEDLGALYVVTTTLAMRMTAENFGRAAIYLDRIPPEFNVFCVQHALKAQEGKIRRLPEDEQRRYPKIENSRGGVFGQWASKYRHLMN
jgi:ATPase family associated with various cellular activities (AAA)